MVLTWTFLGFAVSLGNEIVLKFSPNTPKHNFQVTEPHTIMLFPLEERSQNITFSLSVPTEMKEYAIKKVIGINFGISTGTVVSFHCPVTATLHLHLIEPRFVPDNYLLSTYMHDSFVVATNQTIRPVCNEVTYVNGPGSYGFIHASGVNTSIESFSTQIDSLCTLRYQLGESNPVKNNCDVKVNVKSDGEGIFNMNIKESSISAFSLTFSAMEGEKNFGSYRRYFNKQSDLTVLRKSDSENLWRNSTLKTLPCRDITSSDIPTASPTPSATPPATPPATASATASPMATASQSASPAQSRHPTATRSFITRSRSPKPFVSHVGDSYVFTFSYRLAVIIVIIVIVVCFFIGSAVAGKILRKMKVKVSTVRKEIMSQEQPLMEVSEHNAVMRESVYEDTDNYGIPEIRVL